MKPRDLLLAFSLGVACTSLALGHDGTSNSEPPQVLASVTWSRLAGFRLVKGQLSTSPDTVAWANYTNAINETGWSFLEIRSNAKFPDNIQAYGAGFIEGQITAEIIYMYWQNTVQGYCDGEMAAICRKLAQYMHTNTKWINHMLRKRRRMRFWKKADDSYWHHVSLFYEQFRGLEEGYKSTKMPDLPHGDIMLMNIFGDLEDLSQALAVESGLKLTKSQKYHTDTEGHVIGSGSCSALIKLLPGNKDLYVAHDTWNSYQSMLRIIKKYSMGLHVAGGRRARQRGRQVPGQTLAFSGYPGVIYSGDDFNLMAPSKLSTMETTIGNSNSDLWKFIKPVGQVLEGVRATVANRLAFTGKQWTKIFAKYNSGTYNNQWMVVDYKRFKPGKNMNDTKNLLWVLEQLPGHIHMEDKTDVLVGQGYWPSYNTPYFTDVFNLSGAPAMVEKYGDWFTYDKTPRALIFKRDHTKVVDVESMVKLMRYNNFKDDPLSACNCTPPYSAENAISARNDLNPKNGTYPFGALGHRSHGGTDMKMTNYEMFKRLELLAVSSPTYDDLPPFQWSKVDFGVDTPHHGHPDLWKFSPLRHSWYLP